LDRGRDCVRRRAFSARGRHFGGLGAVLAFSGGADLPLRGLRLDRSGVGNFSIRAAHLADVSFAKVDGFVAVALPEDGYERGSEVAVEPVMSGKALCSFAGKEAPFRPLDTRPFGHEMILAKAFAAHRVVRGRMSRNVNLYFGPMEFGGADG